MSETIFKAGDYVTIHPDSERPMVYQSCMNFERLIELGAIGRVISVLPAVRGEPEEIRAEFSLDWFNFFPHELNIVDVSTVPGDKPAPEPAPKPDELTALRAEVDSLKAENATLKGLLIRIENAARMAENGLMQTYRFPMWIRAAIEKVLVKP